MSPRGWTAAAACALALAGCSALPSAGPSTAALNRGEDVQVVKVTPAEADEAAAASRADERARVDGAVRALEAPGRPAAPLTLGPGAALKVTLWSFPPQTGAPATAAPTPLGAYTVSADGQIVLPYVGAVRLSGLGLEQAQRAIQRRYAALRMFQAPSVAIEMASSPQGQVVVTGAVGAPKILPWPPQGLTLSEALTQSLGDGGALLGVDSRSGDRVPQVGVAVLREGAPRVELPVETALEERIPLQPGDEVMIDKAPLVQVDVLGAGVKSNGVLGFAEPPTLVQALARASGLQTNLADSHAVFVLRRRPGARPVLYDFDWNRAQGLVAARTFPLQNGDVVYVAEAPIVQVERVIGILYQLALPAQTL